MVLWSKHFANELKNKLHKVWKIMEIRLVIFPTWKYSRTSVRLEFDGTLPIKIYSTQKKRQANVQKLLLLYYYITLFDTYLFLVCNLEYRKSVIKSHIPNRVAANENCVGSHTYFPNIAVSNVCIIVFLE